MIPRRSQSIDALRGIAVLSIVLFHSYVPLIGVPLYDIFLGFFRNYGTLGVDLFFLLSGFCIHSAYSAVEKTFAIRNYLLRRWWRIYPPYFFALSLAVILNLMTNYYKWNAEGSISLRNFGTVQILSHLFLVHDLSPSTLDTISGPFWTIALEAQYYLLYLAVRPLFYDRKGWLLVFSSALILHIVAWQMHYEQLPLQPLSPFRYWIEWVLGAFLVYLIQKNPVILNYKWRHVFFFVLSCVAAFFVQHSGVDWEIEKLPFAIAFAFLILLFLSQEKIWSSLTLKWLPGVGLFSYSIYLIHFLFMDRIRAFVIMEIPQGLLRFSASIFTIIFCLAVSYLFFLYFEKPFLQKASSISKH